MLRLSALAFVGTLSVTGLRAQTSDLVVFSEMGEKFTLVVDGEEKNATPASRVEAKGIRNETPLVVVRFADAGIAPLKQNTWMEPGKLYTVKITTNKKGERVMRMQGQTDLGSTATTKTEAPPPTDFVDDGSATQTMETGAGEETVTETTTTVTETGDGDDVENVNMNMGINGFGLNMNVNVTDGTGGTSTSSTTTTTTTTTTTRSTSANFSSSDQVKEKPNTTVVKEPVYVPGYNGPIGCSAPMSDGEFADASKSIESKGFEESKMTLAKQIGRDRCFTVAQVKGIMGLFGFEDSKLDFAKFAYDHVYDKGNYYKVNDAFSFESSIDELNKYIEGR